MKQLQYNPALSAKIHEDFANSTRQVSRSILNFNKEKDGASDAQTQLVQKNTPLGAVVRYTVCTFIEVMHHSRFHKRIK